MTRTFRFLGGGNSSAITESPEATNYDSDIVIIMAALLCALICVLGLVSVTRCAWLRHISTRSQPVPPSNKGLKKKILKSLPRFTFTAESSSDQFSDCAICLVEFSSGDEIRVLPPCSHRFHVACIDTWFASHSSCPSCRQILGVDRCDKCGGFPATSSAGADTSEARLKEREDNSHRFLP